MKQKEAKAKQNCIDEEVHYESAPEDKTNGKRELRIKDFLQKKRESAHKWKKMEKLSIRQYQNRLQKNAVQISHKRENESEDQLQVRC